MKIKIGEAKRNIYAVTPRVILEDDADQDPNGYQFRSQSQSLTFAKKVRNYAASLYRTMTGMDKEEELDHALDLEVIAIPVDKNDEPIEDEASTFVERLHGGKHKTSKRGRKAADDAEGTEEEETEEEEEETEDEE